MELRNPFTPETRELFRDAGGCWECGQNRFDALHHIFGRESSSPFNAAPIHNHGCHLDRGDIHSREKRLEYVTKTSRYLREIGYRPTQADIDFIWRHLTIFPKAEFAYWTKGEREPSIFDP